MTPGADAPAITATVNGGPPDQIHGSGIPPKPSRLTTRLKKENIIYERIELSHQDAQRVVATVQTELEKDQAGAAVAVVDVQGELLAFVRTDGCRLPSITIAINKAYTAAREQTESGSVGEASRQEGFPMTNFGELRYVSWGGGVPILANGQVVGAVGVSGLPEEEDVRLARMGAAVFEQTEAQT